MADEEPTDDPCTGNRQFHGVYLLYCLNPAYKGRTYIGYTVNPQRRIKQHNLGKSGGGAWKTSGRGPWEMVLIIHGFPNDVSGLRFEWAWQNPTSSRRLKHVPRKRKNETNFDAKLRVLTEMLRTGPWNRLPLTIQWLRQEYARPFPVDLQPPFHMPIAYGPIKISNKKKKESNQTEADIVGNMKCDICFLHLNSDSAVDCCNSACSFTSHATCFAAKNCESGYILPITVKCPKCEIEVLWGNLVYGKKQGQEIMLDDEIS